VLLLKKKRFSAFWRKKEKEGKKLWRSVYCVHTTTALDHTSLGVYHAHVRFELTTELLHSIDIRACKAPCCFAAAALLRAERNI